MTTCVLGAAEVLGKIGDAHAVEPLIVALKGMDWSVRSRAATVLGNIKDTRVVGPLIPLLRDIDRDVRKSARETLERIGTPEAKAALP